MDHQRIIRMGISLLGVVLLLSSVSCGKKEARNSSEKSDGAVADATGEARIDSASAEAEISGATDPEALKKKEMVFRVPVAAERLVRGEMKAFLSAVGTLVPEEQILMKAEMGGKITFSQDWQEGQFVNKGTLLATIDNEDIRFAKNEALKALQLAEEQIQPAQEKLKLAERNLASRKRMYEEGVISQLSYDQAELSRMDAELGYKQILASVETRRTELEKVRYRQDRALVEAPFDGILVRKEYLQPQQGIATTSYPIMSLNGRTVTVGEPLVGLMRTSRMFLDVDVSSKEIASVKTGQPAEVFIYGGEIFEATGTVEKISTALDPVTRAFKVTLALDNVEGELRPGMFCKVDIVVERRYDALAIPKETVQTRSNRKVVFVAENQEAREREVVLGISNRSEVEVLQGLHEGDFLITRGYETLRDKTLIKLAEADEDQSEESSENLPGPASGS